MSHAPWFVAPCGKTTRASDAHRVLHALALWAPTPGGERPCKTTVLRKRNLWCNPIKGNGGPYHSRKRAIPSSRTGVHDSSYVRVCTPLAFRHSSVGVVVAPHPTRRRTGASVQIATETPRRPHIQRVRHRCRRSFTDELSRAREESPDCDDLSCWNARWVLTDACCFTVDGRSVSFRVRARKIVPSHGRPRRNVSHLSGSGATFECDRP